MTPIVWLEPDSPFPPVEHALVEPNGLLAAGGDLSPERLLQAYSSGIFPWFEDGQAIMWWSPEPRAVIFPEDLIIRRSLRKVLRNRDYTCTIDQAFDEVIAACAAPRAYADGTWITASMDNAYRELHHLGLAHSFEVWMDGELVGGLYGVSIGRLFFGESMFSRVADASKIAFVHLIKQTEAWGFPLVDCQIPNDHLMSLGASELSRQDFQQYLKRYIPQTGPEHWALSWHAKQASLL